MSIPNLGERAAALARFYDELSAERLERKLSGKVDAPDQETLTLGAETIIVQVAAVKHMVESACAHFQGVGALERMRTHADKQEREFYDDIYAFVKGTYRPKGPLR